MLARLLFKLLSTLTFLSSAEPQISSFLDPNSKAPLELTLLKDFKVVLPSDYPQSFSPSILEVPSQDPISLSHQACIFISNKLKIQTPSILITTSLTLNSTGSLFTCPDSFSNFLGLIKLDHSLNNTFSFISCLQKAAIIKAKHINLKEIIEVRLCDDRFELGSGKCSERTIRILTEEETTYAQLMAIYINYKGQGYPTDVVITMMLNDEALSFVASFLVFLIDELHKFVFIDETISSASQYLVVHTSIQLLMLEISTNNFNVDLIIWTKLYNITTISLDLSDIKSFSNADQIDFIKCGHSYLTYFTYKDIIYKEALNFTYNTLTSYFISIYNEGDLPSTQIIQYPITNNPNDTFIQVSLTIELSQTPTCTCQNYQETTIFIVINTIFKGLGFNSDIFAIEAYNIGTLNSNNEPTYSSNTQKVANENFCDCFGTEKTLKVKGTSGNVWSCHSWFSNCESIQFNINITISFNVFGIFAPVEECGTGLVHNKTTYECETCPSNYVKQNDECICSTGFYDNSTGCSKCPTGCTTCTSASNCQTCSSTYYFDSVSKCLKCIEGCKQCTWIDQCLSCSAGYFYESATSCGKCLLGCNNCDSYETCYGCFSRFEYSDGICLCLDGNYLTGTSCRICPKTCTLCTGANSCTECKSNYLLNAGTCGCAGGMYDAGTECVNCNEKCSLCTGSTTCSQCNSNYQVINKFCACPVGKYDDGASCLPCPEKCSSCSSDTICTGCKFNYSLSLSACSCLKGTFDTNSGCQACPNSCSACTSSAVCTECKSTYTQDSDSCICLPSYFDNGSSCQQCDSKCSLCTSLSLCSSCNSNYELIGNICKCPTGKYNTGTNCENCDKRCSVCTALNSCSSCVENYQVINKICSCPIGQFDNTIRCQQCESKCESCVSLESCSKCKANYEAFNGICACPDGKYNKGSECGDCLSKCSKCSSLSECTGCKSNYEVIDLVCKCPVGKFDNGDGCETCNAKCSVCTSISACQGCVSNYELSESTCLCPLGKFDAGSNCEVCDNRCISCTGLSNCISCKSNYQKVGDICTCLAGFYDHGSGCTKCHEKCTNCVSAIKCSSCINNYSVIQDFCRCPDGYIDTGTGCSAICNQYCTCVTPYTCDSCIPGDYLYVESDNKCYKAYRYVQETDIKSFMFNSAFTRIQLIFNKIYTGFANSSNCINYFDDTSMLGRKPSCTVRNLWVLNINLGAGWNITVNDTLSIIPGSIIIPQGELLVNDPETQVNPEYPEEFDDSVTVKITGPGELSLSCGSASAKYSSQETKSIGKNSLIYKWELTPTDVATANSLENSAILLRDLKNTGENYSFILKLTATNFLKVSGSDSIEVNVTSSALLTIKIDVGESPVTTRTRLMSLNAVIVNRCGSKGVLTYLWSITPPVPGTINYTNKKLQIPKWTFDSGKLYTIGLVVRLTFTSGLSYLESTSDTNVYCDYSPLIAMVNKVDQDIPNAVNLKIDGFRSYDPDYPADKSKLTYSWTTSLNDYPTQTTPNVNIPYSYFNTGVDLIQVTFTVYHLDSGRSASRDLVFTVKKAALEIIFLPPPSKPVASNPLLLEALVIYPFGANLKTVWTQTKGEPIIFSRKPNPFMIQINSNTMKQGGTYGFMITVTLDGSSTSAEVTFTVNFSPFCSEPLYIDPNTGQALSTIFYVSIGGCADRDEFEDLPLTYTFYFIMNTGRPIIFRGNSGDNSFSGVLPAIATGLRVVVCDLLQDCTSYNGAVSVSSRRSMRGQELQEAKEVYEEFVMSGEIVTGISFALNSFSVNEEIIDRMWEDFVAFTEFDYVDDNKIEMDLHIVLLFLDKSQEKTLNTIRIHKYLQKVLQGVRVLENKVDSEVVRLILDIGNRVLDVDTSLETILEIVNITSAIFEAEHTRTTGPYSLQSEKISGLKVVNFIEHLVGQQFEFGSDAVVIEKLNVGSETFISLEIIVFDLGDEENLVYLQIFSKEKMQNGTYTEHEVKFIDLSEETVVLKLRKKHEKNDRCGSVIKENWKEAGCKIISSDSNSTVIQVHNSGIYTLIDLKTRVFNFSALYINLLMVITLSSLLIINRYIEIKQDYSSLTTTELNSNSPRATEKNEEIEEKRTILLSNHLLTNLIYSNSSLTFYQIFTVLFTNLVLQVSICALLYNYTDLKYYNIGIITGLCALFYGIIICTLFLCKFFKAGYLICIGFIICSLFVSGVFCGKGILYVAILEGLGLELFVNGFIYMLICPNIVKMIKE
jgi:hypothetical protein